MRRRRGGVKVSRVELRKIEPPANLVMAMNLQMTAERERRATVARAMGEREAAIARAEGAKQATVLEAQARFEAAQQDAAARERLAEAEARATNSVAAAAAGGRGGGAAVFHRAEVCGGDPCAGGEPERADAGDTGGDGWVGGGDRAGARGDADREVTDGAIWVLVGLGIAALELVAPGFFLIWIGLGALGAGAATELFGLGREGQLAVFAALPIVLIGTIGLRARRAPAVDTINAPASNLIGQTCRAVTFEGLEGRVSLGDGTWYARLVAGERPVAGELLRVVGLEGTVLLVSKA